jgi:transcriptional regulator with XRE-family HTH domain
MASASTIGQRLKCERRKKGLQQKELARLADVKANTISQLENGRQREMGSAVLRRITRALGISANVLLAVDLPEEEIVDKSRQGVDAIPEK